MIRKRTEILRRMLKQEGREILGAERGADGNPVDAHLLRRVQVIIPTEPDVFIWLDAPTPEDLGPDRTYKVPQPASGAQFDFEIMSDQTLFGATQEGVGLVTLVVEYLETEQR